MSAVECRPSAPCGACGHCAPDTVAGPESGTPDDVRSAVKLSQASALVALAADLFELGVTDAGEPFGVRKGGPNVAAQLRGGRTSLRATLAAAFAAEYGKVPTSSALADALLVIEGRAAACDPVELPLRVAQRRVSDSAGAEHDVVVVDLGDAQGRAVVIDRDGWRVVDRSPVLFRRTNLTMPLPVPQRDARDADPASFLRDLNASKAQRRLLVGWLVAALLPDIPHPIVALFGEQGTGKSTAGRVIGETIDPTGAPLRSAPRNEETWQVAAAGSWAVVLDNLSGVAPWLSDALCRAVTGDGAVKRQLYTDSDVTVLRFKRALVMTSIDAGALRGDLAERLLRIDLERIDTTRRRTEAEILESFARDRPRLLGALFDLLADVLDQLPRVDLDELPRMADFARVLRAVDLVTGWDTLADFTAMGATMSADVVDADDVATAVVDLVERHGTWSGTATELLAALSPDPTPRGWPSRPHVLSARIKRAATALRAVGVTAEQGTGRDRRRWDLARTAERARAQASPASPGSHPNRDTAERRDAHRDARDAAPPSSVTDRPAPAQAGAARDARDAHPRHSSDLDAEVVSLFATEHAATTDEEEAS